MRLYINNRSKSKIGFKTAYPDLPRFAKNDQIYPEIPRFYLISDLKSQNLSKAKTAF